MVKILKLSKHCLNYKIQDTIDKIAYTSMPPPYLHSVSLLSKHFVTSLCQQTSRVVYPEDYIQQLAQEEAIFSQWFWITLTQAFD